jgi:hypothetical protein
VPAEEKETTRGDDSDRHHHTQQPERPEAGPPFVRTRRRPLRWPARHPLPIAPGPRTRGARTRRSTTQVPRALPRGDLLRGPDAHPSNRSHPSNTRTPVESDRGTTHSKRARDRHSPSRVVRCRLAPTCEPDRPDHEPLSTQLSHYRRARRTIAWAQRPQMKGVERPILGGRRIAGSASADSRNPVSQAPWRWDLELSAEAHTPAIAIRRKIARRGISNPGHSQTPEWKFLPAGQTRGSSWSSVATTARSSRSRS